MFESAAVHIKPRKIARLLAVTPADVEKRLKKANRFFCERMERLVAVYILHKKGHPNAPRLSRTRAMAARAVYGALAPDCRKAFGLFRAMGCSEQEIAEKLNLELNEVRLRIRQAKKSIRSRVLTTAVLAARKGEDIPTARERIIWRLNYLVSVRQGRQAMPPLPVPDTLTDAEKREVELLFRELEPIRRDVYALHRGLGLEPKETADCLDISREEVAAQVHAVQDGFGERLMQLVAVLLRRAAFVPDTPDMAPSVTETARIAYRFLSEAQQEFFRLYTLSNESVPELADRLGLTADEVAGRLDGVRSTLILRAEILLTSWLREVTDGRMRAETIFRNIEKRREGIFEEDDVTEHGDETDSFINAELIEARKSLMLLDYDCREAFVFGIGAGLGAETVARYQNVSVDEANRRMLDAREMIRLRTEQLMTGMLQLKLSQPDAPRMKETEFYAAKAAFRFIPKECRSVYVRYAVHAEMLGEIARKLNLPYDVAETRLETAVKMVVSRSFAVAIAATSGFKGGEPVAEALLGDPKKIRFPADVWYEPPSQTTDAPQAEPAPTKCRNPVVAALALLAGPPVQLGAAASNAETMALTGLWTAIPTVASLYVGMPIWTLWLLGTEFVVGCVLLRTVPTLPARVQLVKQLFCLYSAAFILPFALLLADWGLYELSGLKLHRWAAFSIYLVGNITPFIWTINHCRRWRSTESGSNDRPEQLRAFLNRGFTAEAFVLAAFFVLLGQDMLCGPSGQPGGASLWPIFALAACFVGLFHLLAYCAFRYFCRFSKGAADSRKHESIPPPKESFWLSREFMEFVRFAPFAMWVLAGNITHLVFVRLHILGSSFEIALYSACWALVWFFNTKRLQSEQVRYDGIRWVIVLTLFVCQLAIHRWLRMNVYY